MAADLMGQFRYLLDHLDLTETEDLLLLFRLADALEGEVVPELAPRMLQASSTPAFRMVVSEIAYYHPDPDWVAPLGRSLRREADVEVFGVGVRALARIGTPGSEEEMRVLSAQTHEPTRRALLSEALQASDPAKAFEHHLGRLMEGSANPSAANLAAGELRRIVGPQHLEALLVAVHHQDVLIARHALKLITGIVTFEAAQFLSMHLLECHQEILDDRELKEVLTALRSVPAAELWAAVLPRAEERFGDRAKGAFQRLREAGPEAGALGELEPLREAAQGTLEPFLVDILALFLEGKAKALPTLFTDATAALQGRGRRIPHELDTCAGGLEFMVSRRLLRAEMVLDLLFPAFQAQTGREVTARVLGALVAPDQADMLEAILATHDANLRAAAQEAIALQREAAFLPFLMRACKDPIEDLANRMILALNGLAGVEEETLRLLESRAPEENQLALRIVRDNRMAGLASRVLSFLDESRREDLSLLAVAVLGGLGHQEAALLERLHSGQSLRLQTGLAEALAASREPATAMALAQAIKGFRQPELWMIAAEGLLSAWQEPLPKEVSGMLVELAQACWEERSPGPWRIRIIQALPALQGADAGHLDLLQSLLAACVDDKRAQTGWTPEQQTQLTQSLRHVRQLRQTRQG